MKEVRYALLRKQGDDEAPPEIRPVILVGPPVPEPPEELRHLHFNDHLLYFMFAPPAGQAAVAPVVEDSRAPDLSAAHPSPQ